MSEDKKKDPFDMFKVIMMIIIVMAVMLPMIAILNSKEPSCEEKAENTRRSCMFGVHEQGAIAECTSQMERLYQMCLEERKILDSKDGEVK